VLLPTYIQTAIQLPLHYNNTRRQRPSRELAVFFS